ncbi:hypothetical protein [Undibacterium sp. Tian12W]|uniref:hypothetical protein n=1 Tax=Undibacterium sp. Tian12W TaxID=3413054 RepID=UPI003BF52AB2
MRRQERYAKEGDPGVAAPKGVPVCAVQKMGRSETRFAQTAALLNPFSVQHKRRLHMGTAKNQKQPQRQKQRHHDLFLYFLSQGLLAALVSHRKNPPINPAGPLTSTTHLT